MVIGIGLLLIIAIVAMIAYLQFPPAFAEARALSVYNKFSAGLTTVLCILFYLKGKVAMPFSPNLKELMALIFALLLELFLLAVFFAIRNFWLFKPKKRGGGF